MAPGDEVVCVALTTLCRCESREGDSPGYRDPVVGQHYVVSKVGEGMCDTCGTLLPLLTPVGREKLGCPPPYAWAQAWFRPLEYDEEPAIVRAGVKLPVKIGEPA